MNDLLPFFENLMSINQAKDQLLELLQNQYQNKNNSINKLYIATNAFNGLLTDSGYLEIIDYLDSSDLGSICLINKYFRYLMLRNIDRVFNDRGYSVHFELKDEYHNKDTETVVYVDHLNKIVAFINLSDRYQGRDLILFEKTRFPINHIYHWAINFTSFDPSIMGNHYQTLQDAQISMGKLELDHCDDYQWMEVNPINGYFQVVPLSHLIMIRILYHR